MKSKTTEFIIEKLACLPFILSKKIKSKTLKNILLFFNVFWFLIIMTLFIPYFVFDATRQVYFLIQEFEK